MMSDSIPSSRQFKSVNDSSPFTKNTRTRPTTAKTDPKANKTGDEPIYKLKDAVLASRSSAKERRAQLAPSTQSQVKVGPKTKKTSAETRKERKTTSVLNKLESVKTKSSASCKKLFARFHGEHKNSSTSGKSTNETPKKNLRQRSQESARRIKNHFTQFAMKISRIVRLQKAECPEETVPKNESHPKPTLDFCPTHATKDSPFEGCNWYCRNVVSAYESWLNYERERKNFNKEEGDSDDEEEGSDDEDEYTDDEDEYTDDDEEDSDDEEEDSDDEEETSESPQETLFDANGTSPKKNEVEGSKESPVQTTHAMAKHQIKEKSENTNIFNTLVREVVKTVSAPDFMRQFELPKFSTQTADEKQSMENTAKNQQLERPSAQAPPKDEKVCETYRFVETSAAPSITVYDAPVTTAPLSAAIHSTEDDGSLDSEKSTDSQSSGKVEDTKKSDLAVSDSVSPKAPANTSIQKGKQEVLSLDNSPENESLFEGCIDNQEPKSLILAREKVRDLKGIDQPIWEDCQEETNRKWYRKSKVIFDLKNISPGIRNQRSSLSIEPYLCKNRKISLKSILKVREIHASCFPIKTKTFHCEGECKKLRLLEEQLRKNIADLKEALGKKNDKYPFSDLTEIINQFARVFSHALETLTRPTTRKIKDYMGWMAEIRKVEAAAFNLFTGCFNQYNVLLQSFEDSQPSHLAVAEIEANLKAINTSLINVSIMLTGAQKAISEMRHDFTQYVKILAASALTAEVTRCEMLDLFSKLCVILRDPVDIPQVEKDSGHTTFMDSNYFLMANEGTDYEQVFATSLDDLQAAHDAIADATEDLLRRKHLLQRKLFQNKVSENKSAAKHVGASSKTRNHKRADFFKNKR